ncbi:O-antigen ligase family protein [Halopseudomonas aestusnigri]|uniref:O-antigen ligase family protein n=1 Tax=Halopseudomonas aestusnigri TaxID=857252 RepID=UPI0030C70BED
MIKNATKFALCLLALFVALGDIDKLIGNAYVVGPAHVLAALFVILHMLLHIKDVSVLVSFQSCVLFLLIIILALAQLNYGASTYSISVINYKLVICVVFFLVLSRHFSRYPSHIYSALSAFSLGCVLLGLGALLFTGVGEMYKGQLIVLGENPNSTSSRMAVGFVFILSCFLHGKPSRVQLMVTGIALSVLMIVIVKSGSRGSLLAVLVSSILLAFLAPMKKHYKLVVLLLMCAGIIFLGKSLLTIDGIAERWAGALQGDTAGRSKIWGSALEIFVENPWIGVGEGGYFTEIYSKEYRFIDAHNLFIYVLVSSGLIGFLVFTVFLTWLTRNSIASLRNGEALQFVLLFNILLISAKTGGALTYLLLWFVLSMVSVKGLKMFEGVIVSRDAKHM